MGNKRWKGPLSWDVRDAIFDFVRFRDPLAAFLLQSALLRYVGIKKGMMGRSYRYFENNFSRGDYYDFGRICLPQVDEEDWEVFLFGFADLIAPYLWPDRRIPWRPYEGHYEDFGVTVNDGDVVIDAGANLGMFSAFAASRGATAYAFEPIPFINRLLQRTAELNRHLNGRILSFDTAMMNYSGTVEFAIGRRMDEASAVLELATEERITVSCTTLDDWVARERIPRIDLIKADIEGAERLMLKGATRVLKEYKPRLAICTYHLKDDPEVLPAIIREANPEYQIRQNRFKLFAF